MIRTIALTASIFALAESPAIAADMQVQFDRDRLGDPAYVEALYAELETAAEAVCKEIVSTSPLYIYELKGCVEGTLASAVKEVGAPMLTAYAAGEPLPAQLAASE